MILEIGKVYKTVRRTIITLPSQTGWLNSHKSGIGELLLILDYEATDERHVFKVLYKSKICLIDFYFESPMEEWMNSKKLFEEII